MLSLINAERFREDFDMLARIGATGDGGVHRPCWSPAHLEAQRWWLARAAEAGLLTRTDSAGNCSAILPSSISDAPTLLLGSHTDSVPNGGRFDGALGVLAALEVARTLKESGIYLPVHIEVIDFVDEEGTLVGILGSKALAGTLTAEELRTPRGGRAALEAGLARAGVTEAGLLAARRDPASLAGYLELHIEQGPNLARRGIPIGIVRGIVGIRSFRLTYHGQANHAGTTPMAQRVDAALGAAAFVLTARELVLRDFSQEDAPCTVNIGQMRLEPGAFNVIPGKAELALEFRAPESEQLNRLEKMLLSLAEVTARQFGLKLTVEDAGGCAPTPLSARAQAACAAAADSLALAHTTLYSGAGHDAMSLAPLTPAGMIFIPSRDGISHSPREYSEWDDCVNGTNVLLRAALNLAGVS
ncbi:MAG: Zn-dependent hydrolase [Anaerolineales bacterium]|nr:Zn-dependent hydrolase [Anaerolineales bacterium]